MSTKPFLILCAVLAVTAAPLAIEPPQSRLNSLNTNIETVMESWAGDNYDVKLVIQDANRRRTVETVADDPQNDLAPRIVGAPNGDTWIVWWNDSDTDEIRVRKRSLETGTWGGVRTVSADGENGRNPAIVHDGDDPWVAYSAEAEGGYSISAIIITDEPDPIGVRSSVATTSYTGNLDVDIHAEGGHVWVTWINDSTAVGWSEFDASSGTWDYAAFDSYATDSVADARGRIRTLVLGQ